MEDFEVSEDDVPQTVETLKFIQVDGTRQSNLDEPLEIRSKEHALLEAAREDVRLFAIFLDDYHISKRPEITLPLRDALTKFVNQLGPNDLVALMEPLTTLYDLKYTRSKSDLLARIRNFEGRYGETFPVKSVIEEAQLSQRNWMELRSGVTLSALKALATQMGGLRDGRKSILFFSQGPGVRPGSPNDQLMREIDEVANRGNVTIHVIDPRPLGAVGFGGDTVLRRWPRIPAAGPSSTPTIRWSSSQAVMADASAYYLVGYAPTRRTNDGKFHEIKVRVKRRGVRVTAQTRLLGREREGIDRRRRSGCDARECRADDGAVVVVGFGEHARGLDLDRLRESGCRRTRASCSPGRRMLAHRPTSPRVSRSSRLMKPARKPCRRR